jgi:ribonuclease Z
MMDHMQKAFAFDIRIRRDVDEKYSKEGITVSSHDIKEGAVFERNGVKVTAFLVDHGPVKPASDTASITPGTRSHCRATRVFRKT